MTWDEPRARALLRRCLDAAIGAADPALMLAAHLPERPEGRCVVVGAGKAAAAMALAVERAWPNVSLSGLVVTRYGHDLPGPMRAGRRIEVVQAAHPVPDAAGAAAAARILELVRGAGPEDLVLALISGGGSALLSLPASGLALADKQAVNRALLACGAPIAEMNAVRSALSAVKGGRLAAAVGDARLVTLAISDVPGDDPATIASGPTVRRARATRAAAAAILARRGIVPPAPIAAFLAREEDAPASAACGPDDIRLIASPFRSLEAAAAVALEAGLAPVILGDAIEGESRELGAVMAGIARSVREHGVPARSPCLLLSGGETVVTLGGAHSDRAGGRNTEFALAFALASEGRPGVWAIACDTDGIDGNQDAAGAVATPSTLARAVAAGLSPPALLDTHDAAVVFEALGDLVRTGPTRTNVNDFRAILVI